jgi:hypothetical protein
MTETISILELLELNGTAAIFDECLPRVAVVGQRLRVLIQ